MERHLIAIKNAKLMWKNFSGVERKAMVNGRMSIVNEAGKRNFNVIIDPVNSEVYFDGQLITDPDFGQTLSDMGYKVAVMPAKDEGDYAKYRMQVEVRYPDEGDSNPRFVPKLNIVNDDGSKTLLFPDTVHELDECDIVHANIEINNSTSHSRDGKEQAKCWCNKGNFWLAHSIIDEY